MPIVFGGDAGVKETALESVWNKMKSDVTSLAQGFANAFTSPFAPPPPPPKENVHVDSGFQNVPGTAFTGSSIDSVDDIQQRNIITQEPILTVYVKKRAFWALRNENQTKMLDAGEKLFLRATKLLFEKKCSQIASYEALTKLQSIEAENIQYDHTLVEKVIDYLQTATDGIITNAAEDINTDIQTAVSGEFLNTDFITEASRQLDLLKEDAEAVRATIDGLREYQTMIDKMRHETQTTWVIDPDDTDMHNVGRGSGVIELTLIGDLNTSLSIEGSRGSFDFTMQDPYNLTKITNEDIESALSAAADEIRFIEAQAELGIDPTESLRGPKYYLDSARRKEEELSTLRRNRLVGFLGPGVSSSTDRLDITFEIHPTSSAPDKVVGTIPTSPHPFRSYDFAAALLRLPLEEQFDSTELQLVSEIFDDLNQYVTEITRINSRYREANTDPDIMHTRKNLRIHYLGKDLVQPMDSVHIYIRGNTLTDQELVGPLAALLNNTQFVKSFVEDTDVSEQMLLEEMRQFGISDIGIPVNIYRAVRTSGALRNGGTHIFGGLVKQVSENYNASNGIYTTRVSGESNLRWLDLSRVNVSPSLDQTQGLLEDPLTPYDIDIDPATHLPRQGNQPLNRTNETRRANGELIMRVNSLYYGEKLDHDTIKHDHMDTGTGGSVLQLRHAPGVVYKWKNGIITATRNVNLQTALQGSENQHDKLKREMGQTVVPEPFAGQDAADIVSLLVTGFPHNYESFYSNATSVGTFTPNVSGNSPQSYFHSFFNILGSQNRAQGNFQPAKIVNSTPEMLQARIKLQTGLKGESKEINNLRSDLARFKDQRNSILATLYEGESPDADPETGRVVQSLDVLIRELTTKIDTKVAEFQRQLGQGKEKLGLRLYGNDLAFEAASGGTAESDNEATKEDAVKLRLRNTLMQMRTQYNCKFNKDINLFVIGDEYDKDLDIQAFALSALGSNSVKLWDSTYSSPFEICDKVKKIIDFEFFCDTQGNIQFRPPRYNKIPLSLMLKMFILDKREDKKLYPEFLQALFSAKKAGIDGDLKVIDLTIKVELLLLGEEVASTAKIEELAGLVIGNEVANQQITIDSFDVRTTAGSTATIIEAKNLLYSETGKGKLYNISAAADREAISEEFLSLNDPTRPHMFANRLARKKKLVQLASRRQRLAEQKEKLAKFGNKYEGDTGGLGPSSDKMAILGPFEDLIEDDFNDFLGPGSSKRYIIYDHQLLSYNFTESDAEALCRVDVHGQEDFIGDRRGNIGNVPVLWAGGTDFDIWRQYGYRPGPQITRPFLKDAESQLAPYAAMLLSRARKNLVTGTITVYGNEYYQLGDVVYLNSRDTLYYVHSVRHQFSHTGTFTTTLELKYGHPLGEYIPTPLDVIGKGLIKFGNKVNTVTTSKELDSKPAGVHLCAVKFLPKAMDDEYKAMLTGPFAVANVDSLKNGLVTAYPYIGEPTKPSYPKIEVRGFYTDNSPITIDKVTKRMEAVRSWFLKVTGRYIASEERYIWLDPDRYVAKAFSPNQISDNSTPIQTNKDELTPQEIARLPKQEVFDLADIDGGQVENVIEVVLIFQEIK